MNITCELDRNALEGTIVGTFERIKEPIQAAMAGKFLEITRMNFGSVGYERPTTWDLLTKSYAKKVGRAEATLFVTGTLFGAIKQENSEDCSKVSVSDSDVPYATVHQYGGKNMPARPYFPVEGSDQQLMPLTRQAVEDAAISELGRLLGGSQ